jgi:hypothetical protein
MRHRIGPPLQAPYVQWGVGPVSRVYASPMPDQRAAEENYSCVRQVQQKDLRCAGSSKAAGAERSLWRELSAAPGGGLGSLPHHEFFVFA